MDGWMYRIEFKMDAGDKKAAWEAVQTAIRSEDYENFGWYAGIEKSRTIEQVLTVLSFVPVVDKAGNIVGLNHTMDKVGVGEELVFSAINPWVHPGSYIGGDYRSYRFGPGEFEDGGSKFRRCPDYYTAMYKMLVG